MMRAHRRARVVLALLSVSVCGACKLDSLAMGGERETAYAPPPSSIPDSLRHEVQFASGGETLHGFWIRRAGSAPRLTVVFSHGNGGPLDHVVEWSHAEFLWQSGFDVLTYDYRGYGRSTGTSEDETTVEADGRAALAFALAQPGVKLSRVVLYGHSLGSLPSIAIAADTPGIRALITEAAFYDGQAVTESADPLGFPVTWLLRYPMANAQRMALVTAPKLILHGDDDAKFPVQQGRDLYEVAQDPKALVIVAGAGHEDLQKVMGQAAFAALVRSFTHADAP